VSVTEAREDLRATSEAIAADADRLVEIEKQKLGLEDDDPQLLVLSTEAERIVRALAPKAAAERELAEETVRDGGAGGPGKAS
jgi:hypothetical protein